MSRMGNKVKVMSSQIEIVTLKKFCEYTEKIKNIEVALSRMADIVIEQYKIFSNLENKPQLNCKGRECIHQCRDNA